jgi:hypothetical protein
MFSQWAYYDDEGFFDYSLKLLLQGHILYNQITSGYGPFYYELWGGLFKLVGHTITTDRGRFIQIGLWLAASFGVGVSVHRLTKSLAMGVIALTCTWGMLSLLTSEPMQADSLACGLVVAILVAAVFALDRWPSVGCAAIGALTAALLLTKINVGAYAVIAVGFAAVMAVPVLAERRALRALAVVAFVGVGPAVMLMTISQQWTQYFVVLTLASTIALVFVVEPNLSNDSDRQTLRSWPLWLIVGFAACFVAVLGVIFALGTTPRALWDSVVELPSKQTSFLTIPLNITDEYVTWSVLFAAGAWYVRQLNRSRGGAGTVQSTLQGGAFRLVVGIAILFSLVQEFPFNLGPDPVFALAMPLAWVAAVPRPGAPLRPYAHMTRILIPALAVESMLIAYPVAGTQVSTGAVLFVVCGAICIADGWRELAQWSEGRTGGYFTGSAFSRLLSALIVALAMVCTFEHVVEPAQTYHLAYSQGEVVTNAKGAADVRFDADLAPTLDPLVATAKALCKTLWSLPGQYSFNMWTGLPTPTTITGGQPFWLTLSARQQHDALVAAKASKGLCIIINTNGLLDDYGGGPPSPKIPLVAFMEKDFHVIDVFDNYLLEAVGKPTPPAPQRHRSTSA